MKKSLLALAVLSAVGGVAQAESSVTLFGVVDLAVQRVTNEGATKNVSTTRLSKDGGTASSRLGFRGVEELGNGLSVGFWIEGALDPDTGNAGGQTWQRRSTVSVMSTSLGEVRLGRDYTPTFWNHTVYDPFGTNGVGSHNNVMNAVSYQALRVGVDADGTATDGTSKKGKLLDASGNIVDAPSAFNSSAGKGDTFVRANNSLGYFLPKLSFAPGLSGQAMFALPEGNASTSNKYLGARLVYASGPMTFAWAGATVTSQGQSATAKGAEGGSVSTSPTKAVKELGTQVRQEKVLELAGSYEFASKLKLMAQYSRYNLADDRTFSNDNRVQNYLVGALYPVNSAMTVKASFNKSSTRLVAPKMGQVVSTTTGQYATTDTVTTAGAKQFAVGTEYALSKRSKVYATYSRLANDAEGTAVVAGGGATKKGGTSSGMEVGVSHSF